MEVLIRRVASRALADAMGETFDSWINIEEI